MQTLTAVTASKSSMSKSDASADVVVVVAVVAEEVDAMEVDGPSEMVAELLDIGAVATGSKDVVAALMDARDGGGAIIGSMGAA